MQIFGKKLFPLVAAVFSLHAFTENVAIINATSEKTDPWAPYIKRPLIDSAEAKDRYDEETLSTIKLRSQPGLAHVPWTIKPLFALKDVVVDRVVDDKTGEHYVDPATGKKYLKFYHATTSDLTNIFAQGASAIRFDVAQITGLGMGFYVAANINEAKFYGCERLGQRKPYDPTLKTIVLILGIEENDAIKGIALDPETRASNNLGEPLDPKVFFAQNKDRENQFVLFKNIAPYLQILKIIILPDDFGRSADRKDGDGLPTTSQQPGNDYSFRCHH